LRVGETEAYTANLIAEAIYAKIDDEGYSHMMMDEIVDHKMDHSAVGHDDSMSLTMAGDIAGEPPKVGSTMRQMEMVARRGKR
jgi:hypothetical protein